MSQKHKMNRITLRYEGLFDFDGFYAAVNEWGKRYEYAWHETQYKHKVPSPRGAEQEFWWQMDRRVTDYVKFIINIQVYVWDLRDVEVESNGKKKTLSNARIRIYIDGHMESDWQNQWKKSKKWGAKLGAFFAKKDLGDVAMHHYDMLYYRMWKLHAMMKEFFDVEAKRNAFESIG